MQRANIWFWTVLPGVIWSWCETLREKQKRGSLLWVLDKTKTAMGARTLRKYVEQPLIDKKSIVKRLDAVEELKDNAICREEIREYLNPVYDLERLVGQNHLSVSKSKRSDCISEFPCHASVDKMYIKGYGESPFKRNL